MTGDKNCLKIPEFLLSCLLPLLVALLWCLPKISAANRWSFPAHHPHWKGVKTSVDKKILWFLTKKTSATIRILKKVTVIISFANLKTSRGQTYHVFQGGIMTPSYPERQHKQTKNKQKQKTRSVQTKTLKNAQISGDNLSKQHFLNILKITNKLSRPYSLFLCFEVRKW